VAPLLFITASIKFETMWVHGTRAQMEHVRVGIQWLSWTLRLGNTQTHPLSLQAKPRRSSTETPKVTDYLTQSATDFQHTP